jgi:uncharacterized protein YprB with RNaseH-like and TPR domain/predicted nuclease with RNAse H fold
MSGWCAKSGSAVLILDGLFHATQLSGAKDKNNQYHYGEKGRHLPVLRSTFLHIPGVGPVTEKMIWSRRIFSWDDFIAKRREVEISENAANRIEKWLGRSERALEKKDALFFSTKLAQRDLWRLYPEFKDYTAFLDIETTGLSFCYDDITLIGLYDGNDVKIFVQGQNLGDFKSEIKKYKIIVTYNGTLFDLHFIRDKFGQQFIPPVHIDLRFLLKRLGYTGGLKAVEKKMNICRDEGIADLSGFDATVLWNRYVRGDDYALESLVRYNLADIVNLKTMLEFAYHQMHETLLGDSTGREFTSSFPKIDVCIKRKRDSLLELKINNSKPVLVDTKRNRTPSKAIDRLLLKFEKKTYPRIIGIDLSASAKRTTGWALLEGRKVEARLLRTDKEIIDNTIKAAPDLVSIDSPLSLPKGRDCTKDSCECRKFGITREAERILRHRGVYVFPSLIQSMQLLTQRGIYLKKAFEKRGLHVIESYPGAAQDILRIIRKKVSLEDLKQGLQNVGLTGEFVNGRNSHDELDAITSALVGYFYLAEEYEALGNKDEGFLIIPRIEGRNPC